MKRGLNRNNKWKMLLILGLSYFTLTGYIFYTPEIVNADKPFVDIVGNTGKALLNAEKAAKENPGSGNATADDPQTQEKKDDLSITIEIIGTTIRVEGHDYPESSFERNVAGSYFREKNITLIDNYGDGKTYRWVRKLLKDHQIRIVEEKSID